MDRVTILFVRQGERMKEVYEIETELMNHNRFIAKGKTIVKVIRLQYHQEILDKISSWVSDRIIGSEKFLDGNPDELLDYIKQLSSTTGKVQK